MHINIKSLFFFRLRKSNPMDVAILSNKLNETSGYIVRPNFEEKFRSTKVQEILYSCISDILGDKKFEQDSCPEWTKTSTLIDTFTDGIKMSNIKKPFIVQKH